MFVLKIEDCSKNSLNREIQNVLRGDKNER